MSIEIKDHKFWKFKTHLYNHHSSKPGHITVLRMAKMENEYERLGLWAYIS